jgi:hypothetical protein
MNEQAPGSSQWDRWLPHLSQLTQYASRTASNRVTEDGDPPGLPQDALQPHLVAF